ncbi:MAG: STAS-like domain-containing protein [Desulfobacteraceae bacterium]|nr:STAS-like domain-containing protein [Desulfobacteraceae bacterium]
MKIRIYDLLGSRCIVKEDGQRIYNIIHPALIKGETVTLNFDGITQFASPFFNFAIGQLLKDITIDDLRKLLQIKNLGSDGLLVIERVIENAGRYHNDVNYRKIVDAILEQQAKESD